ncbi:MAG: matrixin family metalloprotease [Nanoarchaeota archaeon]|nr:matrixin family metalloprotease [Nanoarchaeota archaeon]
MKRIVLGILIGIVVLGAFSVVGAGKLIPSADQARDQAKADNSPVIEKAGGHWALSTPGLEKIIFIHYKKGYGGVCDNDGVCEKDLGENPSCADCKKDVEEPEDPTTSCYAFLGAKWNDLPVSYVIDPDNPDELTEEFVINAMSLGAEEWDNHTSADIFGSYEVDYFSSWDSDAPDGRNELLFGDYEKDGVIAVAIVWGYFRGKPSSRKIIEFDILFDTDFAWGDAVSNPAVMDLQNIATHELGHGVGLADLYDTVCVEETMYGYSSYGDIAKRDLNEGDIIGIQNLYGGF